LAFKRPVRFPFSGRYKPLLVDAVGRSWHLEAASFKNGEAPLALLFLWIFVGTLF
jgi:hypothetical protein